MSFGARPVDRDKAETELVLHIKKATSAEETAPKQKHVRGNNKRNHLLFRLKQSHSLLNRPQPSS